MEKKAFSIMAILIMVIFCQGCGRNGQQEVFASIFDDREDTLINQKKTIGEATITVNHAVFEEKSFIIDYSIEANDVSSYSDISVRWDNENFEQGGGTGVVLEKNKKKQRQILFIDLEGEGISEENLGEKLEIEFYSVSGFSNLGYEEKAIFSLEIAKIYHPNTIKVLQNIAYEDKNTRIDEVVISPFYTKLLVNNTDNDNFMSDYYSYELICEDKSALYWLGSSGNEYLYSPICEIDKNIRISVIQYKEDGSYDYVSDKLEIEIP